MSSLFPGHSDVLVDTSGNIVLVHRELGFSTPNDRGARLNVFCRLLFRFETHPGDENAPPGYWELANTLKLRGIKIAKSATGDQLVFSHDIDVDRYLVVFSAGHAEALGSRPGWKLIDIHSAVSLVKYTEAQIGTYLKVSKEGTHIFPVDDTVWHHLGISRDRKLEKAWAATVKRERIVKPILHFLYPTRTADELKLARHADRRALHRSGSAVMSLDTWATTLSEGSTIKGPWRPATLDSDERANKMAKGNNFGASGTLAPERPNKRTRGM